MDDEVWFDKVPVGTTKLGAFMKDLSSNAHLSAVFTNHSIRATCITNLDQAGFESRHIMSISSHRSESTVKTYTKKCPEAKKHQMSDALADKIVPKQSRMEETTTGNEENDLNFQDNVLELVSVDELNDDILSKFLDKMEKVLASENAITPKEQPMQPINVMNTVNQVGNRMPIPQMYFPNSNVTINYNFSSK